MREAFEQVIRDNPDDVVAHSAYADWLQEQGDPRGEFMAVQLALEDEARSKDERDGLRRREADLLAAHEREWLGELAPLILDAEPLYRDVRRVGYRFARGWLSDLQFRSLTVEDARTFARTPAARMLTRLTVEDPEAEAPVGTTHQYIDSFYQPGPDVPADVDPYDRPGLCAVAHAPPLAGVRTFRLGDGPTGPGDDGEERGGCHTVGTFAHEVVARMPRLEELFLYAHDVNAAAVFALPLPRLRVLRFDHSREYPLHVLADNPSLGSLTHLLCHPHALRPDDPDAYIRMDQLRAICRSPHLRGLSHLQLRLTDVGDDGVSELISSGLLGRLRVLDLSYGCVTDRGAAALAACPQLKHLVWLDLTMNAMTETGVAALRGTGVPMIADRQHGEHPSQIEEDGYLDYLCNGDME